MGMEGKLEIPWLAFQPADRPSLGPSPVGGGEGLGVFKRHVIKNNWGLSHDSPQSISC